MTEKRFELAYEKGNWWAVRDGDITLWKEEVVYLLNKLAEENKQLQEFKDKVFNLIEKTIEDETQIAENIESIIKGDYVKAVNRLTIITLENLKKEFKE